MGVRAGQGFGVAKRKRLSCPACQKRGVTQWVAGPTGLVRYCQYCQGSWGQAGWAEATASTTRDAAGSASAKPTSDEDQQSLSL